MLLDILNQLGPWGWWIVGVILLGLELVVPGSFFVWIGIASIVTGVLALLTDLGWQSYAIVFAVLSVMILIAGRSYFSPRRAVSTSEQPLLNQRSARYMGRVFVLGEPIVDGEGRIRIDDTSWRITGPDLPSGARVTVTGADGAVLKVAAG